MITVAKRKSTNLFEPHSKASRIKILRIDFPNFELSKHGEDFLKFERLEELFIQSDVMQSDLLPEEIGRLKTISKLYILNFHYKEFPKWIFNLSNLKSLMLRGNDIKKIPDEIIQLTKLEKLRIENCALTELPLSLSSLGNLKQLSLSDNSRLTTLNAASLPESLKAINLIASGINGETIKRIESRLPRLRINEFVE